MHSLQTLLRICPIVPQVCNAVYLRLNFSVPLCACPEPGDPCSASTLASDGHSLGLTADQASGKVRALRLIFSHLIFTLFPPQPNQPHLPFKVLTLAKTCEEVESIRTCDQNRDWSILALQNIRTGKAHYLVICTCPDSGFLGKDITRQNHFVTYLLIAEGPLAQTGAPYAKVPGIRVFGMLCLSRGRGRPKRRKAKMLWGQEEAVSQDLPSFPDVPEHLWEKAHNL